MCLSGVPVAARNIRIAWLWTCVSIYTTALNRQPHLCSWPEMHPFGLIALVQLLWEYGIFFCSLLSLVSFCQSCFYVAAIKATRMLLLPFPISRSRMSLPSSSHGDLK
jgi:hypothetical protein